MKALLSLVAITCFYSGCRPQVETQSDVKIVGGKLADPAEVPYLVAVAKKHNNSLRQFCGGTLIDQRIVLTAAHCVDNFLGSPDFNIYVGFGIVDANNLNDAKKFVRVRNIRVHEDFDVGLHVNDIALLYLDDYDASSFSLKPELLALNTEAKTVAEAKFLTASGFGNTTSFGFIADRRLRKVDVKPVSTTDCKSYYETRSSIDERIICAGRMEEGGYDTCTGDSGGPLVGISNDGEPVLVGVTSWGEGCALERKPGIYANVTTYLPWIEKNKTILETTSFGDQENVFRDLLNHCGKTFSEVQSFTNKANTGFIQINYTPAQSPDLLETTARLTQWAAKYENDSDHRFLQGCAYQVLQPNDTIAWLMRPNGAKPEVQVNQTSTLKLFHFPAIAHVSVSAICNHFEDNQMSLWFNDADYEANKVDLVDSTYSFNIPANEPTDIVEINSCALNDFVFKIWRAKDGIHNYVSVAGPHVSTANTWFLATTGSANTERSHGVQLTATKEQTTQTKIAIQNLNTKESIYTWQLDCPFGISLTDDFGQTYLAEYPNQTTSLWTFSFPALSIGRIAPNQTVNLTLHHSETDDPTLLQRCRINSEQTKFSYETP